MYRLLVVDGKGMVVMGGYEFLSLCLTGRQSKYVPIHRCLESLLLLNI